MNRIIAILLMCMLCLSNIDRAGTYHKISERNIKRTLKFIGYDKYAITNWTLIVGKKGSEKRFESNNADSIQINQTEYKPKDQVKIVFNKRELFDKLYKVPTILGDTTLTMERLFLNPVYKFPSAFQ